MQFYLKNEKTKGTSFDLFSRRYLTSLLDVWKFFTDVWMSSKISQRTVRSKFLSLHVYIIGEALEDFNWNLEKIFYIDLLILKVLCKSNLNNVCCKVFFLLQSRWKFFLKGNQAAFVLEIQGRPHPLLKTMKFFDLFHLACQKLLELKEESRALCCKD